MANDFLYPDQAETLIWQLVMDNLLNNGACKVTLYSNNHTPAASDTISDYTYGSITAVTLSSVFNTVAQDGSGKASTDLTSPLTLTNASGGSVTYYGVLVYKSGTPDKIIGAAKFASSLTLPNGGQRLLTLLLLKMYYLP